MLFISDTCTNKKTKFIKRQNNNTVTLYVCGITPYDAPHIGHGRCYVVFDIVYRYLSFLSYDVVYCRNYTDIDDKLLHKSFELFQEKNRYKEVANINIVQFELDMQQLNCLPPTHQPRVTENINEIIFFIETLIQKKYAYVSDGNVYFSIETSSDYGKLSKQNSEELLSGTRHDVRDEKRNPLDFVLWKKDEESFFWKSPWGIGRPGWHIECSALAKKYLGEFVDIHGGGLDLIFPHHENEIVQSESLLGHDFVHYWMHVGLVMSNQEKMSKSLGNFRLLKDVYALYDPMVLRYYYLAHHYRSPLPFSNDMMEAYGKAYHKLCLLFVDTENLQKHDLMIDHPVIQKMFHYLNDDFNVSAMLAVIFENMVLIKADKQLRNSVAYILKEICGLTLKIIETKEKYSDEIQALIQERFQARKIKQWKRADEIRDQLKEIGIIINDEKID